MPESIAELMTLSEDELLQRLGFELEQAAPGIKPLTLQERSQEARHWLAKNRSRIANMVCNDPRTKAFQSSSRTQDRVQLAAGVLDVLAALAGIVGPATVAVLLAKEGLDTLCPEAAGEG